MAQVSYAMREDPNSIYLLEDAGKHYDKYCQITSFARNLVKPVFFRQYFYFVPCTGSAGKYRGDITNVRLSMEDDGCVPLRNYIAIIDSEVEFTVTPTVIRQLSREYMPAWGVKSYLDYFSDNTSGVLLFLRVYRVNQKIPLCYWDKGIRGSALISRLYDEFSEEVSLSVDIIEPVISDNKFAYLKDEIIHILKVENAFISLYENTEKGLNSLQDRLAAERSIQGTKERWQANHLGWMSGETDEDDDFDMAQLDYESIYREVLNICPSMEVIIDYVRNLQPARLGEYEYCLQDIHTHSDNEIASFNRLFDMSLRSAVKTALYYHKRYGVDIEDAFQESCVGIISAIRKHNDNVSGLFPSYVAIWMRQVLNRNASPYDYNMRLPVHYSDQIKTVVLKLNEALGGLEYKDLDFYELFNLIKKNTELSEEEVFRMTYILSPAQSIEEIIENPKTEEILVDSKDYFEEVASSNHLQYVRDALNFLNERERDVLLYRFGFDGRPETSLEGLGRIYGLTRERIRQIEKKAKDKVLKYLKRNHLLTEDSLGSIVDVDEKGKVVSAGL